MKNNNSIIIDIITIIVSLIAIGLSIYSIKISKEANTISRDSNYKAEIANKISVSQFNFAELDDDVKKIQNVITNKRLSEIDTISDEDKKILIDVYNGLTQHIGIDLSNTSANYKKVLEKGKELKDIMEQIIIELVPELAKKSSNDKPALPVTGELSILEITLNDYKSLKRKFLLEEYNN